MKTTVAVVDRQAEAERDDQEEQWITDYSSGFSCGGEATAR